MAGEFTTDGGPWFDDYFLVLIAGHPPLPYEAPTEAIDLHRLAADLGIELQALPGFVWVA